MELETSQLEDQDALFDKRIAINDEYNEKQLEIADADAERRKEELEKEKELAEQKKAIRERMFNDMQALIASSLEAQGTMIENEYDKEVKLAEANGRDTSRK